MLVFFLGPSGIGKSSTMMELSKKHQWKKIPVYSTRKPREFDDKICISKEKYFEMERNNMFFRSSEIFSNHYGNLKSSFLEATSKNCKDFWCLDLSESEIIHYKHMKSLKIIIIPENIKQLNDQLLLCKRSDRIEGSVQEYSAYLKLIDDNLKDLSFFVVLNKFNKHGETINNILEISEKFFSEGL